ncbi:MAG: hypothetical protein U5J97_00850 [Trueperaceae bacterium]|nr:hypothetical protein [Trueperaceae bacterium]
MPIGDSSEMCGTSPSSTPGLDRRDDLDDERIAVLAFEPDQGTELDGVHVVVFDDHGAGELVLEIVEPVLDRDLLSLGLFEAGVVVVVAGAGQLAQDAGRLVETLPFVRDALLQALVAFLGDADFPCHGVTPFRARMSRMEAACSRKGASARGSGV